MDLRTSEPPVRPRHLVGQRPLPARRQSLVGLSFPSRHFGGSAMVVAALVCISLLVSFGFQNPLDASEPETSAPVAPPQGKKIITPEGTGVGLPFSPAVQSGDFVYLAGALGNEPGTLNMRDGFEQQMRQTMSNLEDVLDAAGLDFSRVVSSNVYLSDARHFSTMNEIYRGYFGEAPPIRATVEADIALPGAMVEISMVAVRRGVEKKVIRPSKMKSPELPYSWGIQAGNTLFVAGATARNPDTYQPIGGDMAEQTTRVLKNIGLVLEEAGMSHDDLARCTVFLDDARDFQAMNEAYRDFFGEVPPARATVRAKLMNPKFLSEIQCIAVQDDSRKMVMAEGATRSASPFSPAIQVSNRLYLAGMVGRGANGLAPGDVKAQTRQTLENIGATLEAANMTYNDIVDVMVYVSDMRYYQDMNEVYREIMPDPPPARATVGAPLMSPAVLVEIVVTAER